MSPFHAAGEPWQMMEGSLVMSRKERKRLALLAQVKSGELKLVTAGEVTNKVWAQCFEEETTRASYDVFEGWVRGPGLPQSL